jgi:hypothetical protein
MHNPWEEFLKKTIFLMALGFWVSTTETFHQTFKLLDENKKVIQETRSTYSKMGASVKFDQPKVEVKTNSR